LLTKLQIENGLAETLIEIIEALNGPASANDTDALLELVQRGKSADLNDEGSLDQAAMIFENRRGREAQHFMFRADRAAQEIAAELKAMFPSWPHFVYHGTSTKAISSIYQKGLIARVGKSRWTGVVDDKHLASGVFFTDTWRGAIDWAYGTALTRAWKPRKDESRPVVLRVLAADLSLQPDILARRSGCLVSSCMVDMKSADAAVLETSEGEHPPKLISWLPLASLAGSQTLNRGADGQMVEHLNTRLRATRSAKDTSTSIQDIRPKN
jgi:hypothetical protein